MGHGAARTLELPRWPAISASMMSDGESLSGSPMHCRKALMLLHASPPISVNTCSRPQVQAVEVKCRLLRSSHARDEISA